MPFEEVVHDDDWKDVKIPQFSSLRLEIDSENLESHQLTKADNVRFYNGKIIESVPYTAYHATTLSGTPMSCFNFLSQTGTKTTYLLTTAGVYYDDGTDWQEIVTNLTGSEENQFSIVPIPWSDQIAFTNGIDPVKIIDSATNTITDLVGPTGFNTCKALAIFDSSLILLNTVEDSDFFPQRIRACDNADITTWTGANSFSQDLFESSEPIVTAVQLGPYLIIYREKGIHRMVVSSNPLKRFDIDQTIPDQGVFSVGSVCQINKNQHAIFGSNDLYTYNGGFALTPIGTLVREQIFGDVNDEDKNNLNHRQLIYLEDLQELMAVYYPDGGSGPTKAVVGDLRTDSWSVRSFTDPIRGASKAATTVSTPWSSLIGTWAEQTVSWSEYFTNVGGEPILIFASDNGTYTFDLTANGDNGTIVTKTVETKDFDEYPFEARMDWLDVRMASAGYVNISYSLDHGGTWTLYKSVNIANTSLAVYRIHGQFIYESIRFRFESSSDDFQLHSINIRIMPETEIASTTPIDFDPDAPVLTATSDVSDSVSVSWTAPTRFANPLDRYELYRSVDDGTFTLITTTDNRTYIDTNVDRTLHTYDYYVIVYDIQENSAQSNTDGVELLIVDVGTIVGVTEQSFSLNTPLAISVDLPVDSVSTLTKNNIYGSTRGVNLKDIVKAASERLIAIGEDFDNVAPLITISDDQGVTWTEATSPGGFFEAAIAIDVNSSSNRIIFINDEISLFYTDDEGNTITAIDSSILLGSARDIASNGSGTWVAVSSSTTSGKNIIVSTDDGDTWSASVPTDTATNAVRKVIYDSATDQFIIAQETGSSTDAVISYIDGALSSWTKGDSVDMRVVTALGINPTSGRCIVAGKTTTTLKLYYKDDITSAASWTSIASQLSSFTNIWDLKYFADAEQWIAVGANSSNKGLLAFSDNDGETWTTLTVDTDIRNIYSIALA